MEKIKLIIGLGNPDPEYQQTYHNVGHIAVDFLKNFQFSRLPVPAAQAAGGQAIFNFQLLKTDVYMNKSGEFVRKAMKKYKAGPEQLLVIHDDSDIELGKYKLSFGRSSAGHKGVQNIINHLKTQNFWRLRIGIRPSPEKKRTKADVLVLKKIAPANKRQLDKVFKEAVKLLE